jgi:hypothetical protein
MQELIKWKSGEERKPMVLKGARQVGKTWLMKEFGQNYYKSFVYFNFDEEDELKSIFELKESSSDYRAPFHDCRREDPSC